jgi:hypothetical protein
MSKVGDSRVPEGAWIQELATRFLNFVQQAREQME